MFFRLISIFFMLVASGFPAFGIGEEMRFVKSDEFIEQYWNIIHARVVKAELYENKWNATFTFEVLEAIRGHQTDCFVIEGNILSGNTWLEQLSSDHDFENKSFWNSTLGRCSSDEGQNVMPSFLLGWEYLIFMDAPFRIRSFEIINNKNDEWLQYVKKIVVAQSDDNELIRLRSGLREVYRYASDIKENHSLIDSDLLTNFGVKFVRNNPLASNADLKAFMYDSETIEECLK